MRCLNLLLLALSGVLHPAAAMATWVMDPAPGISDITAFKCFFPAFLLAIMVCFLMWIRPGLHSFPEVFSNGLAWLKKIMGRVPEKDDVPFELSEFIVRSRNTMKNLPPGYQRLYQSQSQGEASVFVNREKELALMGRAYENWNRGCFITCAVIGEKGSGVTSLLNRFLLDLEPGIQTTRYTLNEKVYTQEKYFMLFNRLFQTDDIQSNESLIQSLNEAQGKRIIVLENLQHMFLKRVSGFDCMKMLFEIMVHTASKVFWVGAWTPHSWEYLDKTIAISSFFTNAVRLEQMLDDSVRKIITECGHLAGYRHCFAAPAEKAEKRSFRKQEAHGKSSGMEDAFFTGLNRLANGNISLAQFYWLCAVIGVDVQSVPKSVEVGAIGRLDFSFIRSLSGDALFALQTLLLHDGLTLEDFALAMNEPESVSRNLLMPMLEKGLLIRPRQKFNINPMIYQYVTAYLTSRNFIH